MKPTEQAIDSEQIKYCVENNHKFIGKAFVDGANWTISEMQQEWVSVKDRLPQGPDIVYLVSVKNKNKENGIPLIDIAVFDSDGTWQKSTVWEDVTHWTPLPDAPQPPTE